MNNSNTTPQKEFVRGDFPPAYLSQQLHAEYGIELTKEFLILLPYLDYVIKNGGHFDMDKITTTELDHLILLNEVHVIELHETHIKCISKSFYDLMSNILYYSYIEH